MFHNIAQNTRWNFTTSFNSDTAVMGHGLLSKLYIHTTSCVIQIHRISLAGAARCEDLGVNQQTQGQTRLVCARWLENQRYGLFFIHTGHGSFDGVSFIILMNTTHHRSICSRQKYTDVCRLSLRIGHE